MFAYWSGAQAVRSLRTDTLDGSDPCPSARATLPGPTSWPRLSSVGVRAWGCGEWAAGPAYPSVSSCQGPSCPRLRCLLLGAQPLPPATPPLSPLRITSLNQVQQLPPLPECLRPSMTPRAAIVTWGSLKVLFYSSCVLFPGCDPAFQQRTCVYLFQTPRTCPRLLPHARGNGDCSLDGHWSFRANPGKLAGPVAAHPKAVGSCRLILVQISSLHPLETGFPAGGDSSWSTLRDYISA